MITVCDSQGNNDHRSTTDDWQRKVIFQVTGSGAAVCLSLRNAAIVSLASLITTIGSFSFLGWENVLPVKGHVCIRIGKWKTSVGGPEIIEVKSLTRQRKVYLRPALRRLMLMSARADRARAP